MKNKMKSYGIWFDFIIQPEDEWKKMFDQISIAGISECFVKANKDQLRFLISLAGNYDLNVHGWMWTLNRPYEKEPSENSSWFSINKNGQNCYDYRPYVDYYQWLSPFSEGAIGYIKNNVKRIASIDGLASVHLDYVRYCDLTLPIKLQKKQL